MSRREIATNLIVRAAIIEALTDQKRSYYREAGAEFHTLGAREIGIIPSPTQGDVQIGHVRRMQRPGGEVWFHVSPAPTTVDAVVAADRAGLLSLADLIGGPQ